MRLVILGATGSVGKSAYNVWEQHQDKMAIEGLVAHRQGARLWKMGKSMGARWIALTDSEAAYDLMRLTAGERGPRIVAGIAEMMAALEDADATHVLAAMTGFAGLGPAMAALRRGLTVLLANKETLVAAGDLVRREADQFGGQVIPVDSEHSAIFQCLALPQPLRRIVLTCSGGPFRGRTRKDLEHVTVEAALNHPRWSMGPKITIDSATLMNKGLEVIEAHHLFRVDYDAIDVVVHPESIVHSMVEFADGATMAQCGHPDMRVPIAVAMAWPDRWALDVPPFKWPGVDLHFEEPDLKTFPLLDLARSAGISGGLYPAVLNAANEVAVQGFLDHRISFLAITDVVEETLNAYQPGDPLDSVQQVIEADFWARQEAEAVIDGRTH